MQTLKKKKIDPGLWPFDTKVNACKRRTCTMDYRSTEFGVDNYNRFSFRARTDRQTDRQMQPNVVPHAGGYTTGVGNKLTATNESLTRTDRLQRNSGHTAYIHTEQPIIGA